MSNKFKKLIKWNGTTKLDKSSTLLKSFQTTLISNLKRIFAIGQHLAAEKEEMTKPNKNICTINAYLAAILT